MVFYYTSANIKLLKIIHMDYLSSDNCVPYEYIVGYIEECPPDCMSDAKLQWVAETFLSTQKHIYFLTDLVLQIAADVEGEGKDYYLIILHAILFQLQPEEYKSLYKCLFNLSKPVLAHFSNCFSNNEILPYVEQIASVYYDGKFVSEKIISPLFSWQPYISEMDHEYKSFTEKNYMKTLKAPTIPKGPSFLYKVKPKQTTRPKSSVHKNEESTKKHKPKMLTVDTIKKNILVMHEQNKQRATQLLEEVKNNEFSYAKDKSKKYYDTMDEIVATRSVMPKRVIKKVPNYDTKVPIKYNATTIRRISKQVYQTEQMSMNWLQGLDVGKDNLKYEKMIEKDRQDKMNERQADIEKIHLMTQIQHEDAVLAKHKIIEENKKKYCLTKQEKEQWDREKEELKMQEDNRIKALAEETSMLELEILHARAKMLDKKKENAEEIRETSKQINAEFLRKLAEERQKRAEMIKEFKVLSEIAKKAKIKIIDFTETSGSGLLCEMSIAELKERLVEMRCSLKEELQKKKLEIKSKNEFSKKELDDIKCYIEDFIKERNEIKSVKKSRETNNHKDLNPKQAEEINKLKDLLNNKRLQRMGATKSN